MQTLEQQFHSRVNAFLARTGLTPTAFGKSALGDPNLMREIGRGRSPSLRTADRLLAFIDTYDLDSGGARAPPPRRRRWSRKSMSRPQATRSARSAMGGRPMRERPRHEKARTPTRILRMPEVEARTGLSRSTINVLRRQGRFPQPVRVGARALGWIESEIEEWIRERIAESRGVPPHDS